MGRLTGKNVIITGASSGIGQAIAIRFAEEGANVAINYRKGPDQARAVEMQVHEVCLAQGRGPDCRDLIIQADVSDEHQVRQMFAHVIDQFGRVDVLVNNAGIQKPCPSHEIELRDFDQV
ncbi:MAG: SDR family NAD(P)-dependent oxidoreductase, partial [Bryobacteraceae bacterium]|nr:SDR family NAD(P)-dependent oxidoreductase [Bryobacteraceae bacterium]